MKAKLNKKGFITIKAENISEGFAIESLFNNGEKCKECGLPTNLFLVDTAILSKKKKKDTITER